MAAPAAEAPPAAPGGGAVEPPGGGGQSAQILQQIQMLLVQLGQSEPDPEVQHLVQQAMQPIQALEGVVGKTDEANAMSGLHNPGGEGGEGVEGAGAEPAGGSGGGEHHVVEVHIGVPAGGPKTPGDAKKAAMANFKEKGHFSGSTPKGVAPQTDRTKNRAKG